MEEQKAPEEEADLQMAFHVFDTETNGYVNSRELRRCLVMLAGKGDQEIAELVQNYDLREDREISFEGSCIIGHFNPFTPKYKMYILPTFYRDIYRWGSERIGTIIIFRQIILAMKSQVLHTVWCNISAEAAGKIWKWPLLGVRAALWNIWGPLSSWET